MQKIPALCGRRGHPDPRGKASSRGAPRHPGATPAASRPAHSPYRPARPARLAGLADPLAGPPRRTRLASGTTSPGASRPSSSSSPSFLHRASRLDAADAESGLRPDFQLVTPPSVTPGGGELHLVRPRRVRSATRGPGNSPPQQRNGPYPVVSRYGRVNARTVRVLSGSRAGGMHPASTARRPAPRAGPGRRWRGRPAAPGPPPPREWAAIRSSTRCDARRAGGVERITGGKQGDLPEGGGGGRTWMPGNPVGGGKTDVPPQIDA